MEHMIYNNVYPKNVDMKKKKEEEEEEREREIDGMHETHTSHFYFKILCSELILNKSINNRVILSLSPTVSLTTRLFRPLTNLLIFNSFSLNICLYLVTKILFFF